MLRAASIFLLSSGVAAASPCSWTDGENVNHTNNCENVFDEHDIYLMMGVIVFVGCFVVIAAIWHRRHNTTDRIDLAEVPAREAITAESRMIARRLRRSQERSPECFAACLLAQCSPEARATRDALAKEYVKRFGFQPDNIANQMEHFESLLLSRMSFDNGNYDSAIQFLHWKIMQPVRRWRLFMENGEDDVLVRKCRTPCFDSVPPEQCMREIILYLCIWGEASNLRFSTAGPRSEPVKVRSRVLSATEEHARLSRSSARAHLLSLRGCERLRTR